MSLVKVAKKARIWNRDAEDYKATVMGDEVFIPGGGSVVVSRRQAVNIKGHYCGKGKKVRLEVEPMWEEAEESEVYIDHKTGQMFPSRSSLLKHLGVDESAAEAVKHAPKYLCPVCDTPFENKEDLLPHVEKCLAKVKATKVKTA